MMRWAARSVVRELLPMTSVPQLDFFVAGPAGRLAVRAKGLGSGLPTVVLVQGANLSGQTAYDFTIPGGETYSLMDALLDQKIASITFSIRGYGLSDKPDDPLALTTDHAIEDLAAVFDWLGSQGVDRPHLLGWSWGGRIAGRFTEQQPDHVDRLVLFVPALGGGDLIPPVPTEPWWVNTPEYFAEHLEPEFTEPALRRALAEHIAIHDRVAPNGIRRENALGSIPVIPERISRPTLLIYGSEAAKQPYLKGALPRADFFERLATKDKAFVIIPDCGDYAHLQRPRHRVHAAIAQFLKI
jgi:pimeloyl-ACP methyl ester carboxylesterase